MRLFGKAKKAPPVSESLQKMREAMDNLEKRETYLQQKHDYETEIARKNARSNKRVAMQALKRRKTYEQQMERISNARMNLEVQILHIENAAVNMEALKAMELGAQAMKQQQQNMTVHDVDNIMETIREQMDVQEEIGDAMSQPLGTDLIDEDALEAELQELEQQVLDEEMLKMPSVGLPSLSAAAPAVPSHRVAEEEDEFAKLEGSMI